MMSWECPTVPFNGRGSETVRQSLLRKSLVFRQTSLGQERKKARGIKIPSTDHCVDYPDSRAPHGRFSESPSPFSRLGTETNGAHPSLPRSNKNNFLPTTGVRSPGEEVEKVDGRNRSSGISQIRATARRAIPAARALARETEDNNFGLLTESNSSARRRDRSGKGGGAPTGWRCILP